MSKHPTTTQIEGAYVQARDRYALIGVDTEQAMARLAGIDPFTALEHLGFRCARAFAGG